MDWLVRQWNWPSACLFTSAILFLITPMWWQTNSLAIALVFVQLPIYMLHQWEEHKGDRFRKYFNERLAGGLEALTPIATFWINALGVWAVDLIALGLAVFWRPSLGLIAFYLPVVNALGHLGPAVRRREYNPGLGTGLVLFIPIGLWGIFEVSSTANSTLVEHAIGLGGAVGLHVTIILHVVRRLAALKK